MGEEVNKRDDDDVDADVDVTNVDISDLIPENECECEWSRLIICVFPTPPFFSLCLTMFHPSLWCRWQIANDIDSSKHHLKESNGNESSQPDSP